MILAFGAILMNIHIGIEKGEPSPGVHLANNYEIGVGGKAALQALAAAKSNARVAAVGYIGDDHYGKNILLRLRQHGVVTSGVGRHEQIPTGTHIQIGYNKVQTIIAHGAAAKANHEQIPTDILHNDTLLLLQDELPYEQNAPLLPKAKECNTKVILNAGVICDIEKYDLNMLDYVITDYHHADIIKYVKSKAPNKLITIFEHGAAISTSVQQDAIEIEDKPPIDKSCAEDAFCGTFAAAIFAGQSEASALKRAAVAYALTESKKGGYHALPYPDDIKEALANL